MMNKVLAIGFEKLAGRTNCLGKAMSKYRLEDAVETFAKATKSTPVYKVANRYKSAALDGSGNVPTYIFERTGTSTGCNIHYEPLNSFPSSEDWKLLDEVKKLLG